MSGAGTWGLVGNEVTLNKVLSIENVEHQLHRKSSAQPKPFQIVT